MTARLSGRSNHMQEGRETMRSRLSLAEHGIVAGMIVFALLLILPLTGRARDQARSAACMTNLRLLTEAWLEYVADYDGHLVGGSDYYSGRRTPYRWVERPLYRDTDNPGAPPEGYNSPVPPTSELCLEYRLNGIRAGKLFPYVQDTRLYHCPNDRTWLDIWEPYAAYRSYSISGTMNAEDYATRVSWPGYVPPSGYRAITMPDGSTHRLVLAEDYSQIRNPSGKVVFVEESSLTHNLYWLYGSFVLMAYGRFWSWWDWPAPFHGNQSNIGFADGHVELKQWQDERTIRLNRGEMISITQPDNPDLLWMIHGYMLDR